MIYFLSQTLSLLLGFVYLIDQTTMIRVLLFFVVVILIAHFLTSPFPVVKYVHEKHNLQKVGELKGIEKSSTNKHINRIKNIIDKALIAEGVNDIKTLQNEVLKSGIKSFTQRGISFIDNYSF